MSFERFCDDGAEGVRLNGEEGIAKGISRVGETDGEGGGGYGECDFATERLCSVVERQPFDFDGKLRIMQCKIFWRDEKEVSACEDFG